MGGYIILWMPVFWGNKSHIVAQALWIPPIECSLQPRTPRLFSFTCNCHYTQPPKGCNMAPIEVYGLYCTSVCLQVNQECSIASLMLLLFSSRRNTSFFHSLLHVSPNGAIYGSTQRRHGFVLGSHIAYVHSSAMYMRSKLQTLVFSLTGLKRQHLLFPFLYIVVQSLNHYSLCIDITIK